MKRRSDSLDSSDAPPAKKGRIQRSPTQWNADVAALIENETLCDITFCVPNINCNNDENNSSDKNKSQIIQPINSNMEEEKADNDSAALSNDNNNGDLEARESEYIEYKCHRFPFIAHSSVLKALIYENVKKSDINTKIQLNDFTPITFEFIRDYCYGLQPSIAENIEPIGSLFDLLVVSHKYGIESLISDIMIFIKTEWITSKGTLFSFLRQCSKFHENSNNDLVLHYIPEIVNNNTILQRYACEMYWPENNKCHPIVYELDISILIELLKCDSFYLSEHFVWQLCLDYCTSKRKETVKPQSFQNNMPKLIPFIRFDIIGLNYFSNKIEPILLKYNLMNKSQLYDIYHSWQNEKLLKEKFTLKHQRFLFDTNYLDATMVDSGNLVDICLKSEINRGFRCHVIVGMDANSGIIVAVAVHGEYERHYPYEMDECIFAKPYTCGEYSMNNRFIHLNKENVIEFKTIDKCKQTDPWIVGRIRRAPKDDGEIQVKALSTGISYYVSVNDPAMLKYFIN